MSGRREWERLEDQARADAVSRDPVVILPLAATEQHGPHLPLSTDVDIGEGILAAALAAMDPTAPVFRTPTRAVGVSLEHADYPGTETVPAVEMEEALVRQGRSLAEEGIRRLLLFNSHGGNKGAMDNAALRLRVEHGLLVVKTHWFRFPRPPSFELPEEEWIHGLHGGAVETAMMLHLHPDRVNRPAVRDFPSLGQALARDLTHLAPEGAASFAWTARDLNPQGVTGNATLASAAMGSRLVGHYAHVLGQVILDTLAFPLDRLARDDG